MATAKEMLMAELQRRQAQEQSDQGKIREDIESQRAMAEIDPAYRRSMAGTAIMQDLDSGTNKFTQAERETRPESTEVALRRAFQAQANTPKQNLLGYLQGQIGQENAQAKMALESKDKTGPKELTANAVMKVQEGDSIPPMLDNIATVIESNSSIFGPVVGRGYGANPWSEQGKTVDAEMRATSQAFGRFMEGGVLKEADERKYKKMFPQLSDTPAIARNKLNIVRTLLREKQNGLVGALDRSGFDMTAFTGNKQQPQQAQLQAPQQERVAKTQNNFDDPNAWSTEEIEAFVKEQRKGL